MIFQRAALLTGGSLAALGLSTGLAHADSTTLFSGDGITITDPGGLTGTGTYVGGLPPIDSEYEYTNQTVDINGFVDPHLANVYTDTDLFTGNDTLVDLTPGQPIADSDIFSNFSLLGGAVQLEHFNVAVPLDGLTTGSYDAVVVGGTPFVIPDAVTNLLGPDFGLTALDVTLLTEQATNAAAALDVTPFLDVLTSLF